MKNLNKKQKKVFIRILVALGLLGAILLLTKLVALPQWLEAVLYLIPYLVIGYDILIKAGKGIKNRQPFDECFLMAVATVGAMALGEYLEGADPKAVMPFVLANCRKVEDDCEIFF